MLFYHIKLTCTLNHKNHLKIVKKTMRKEVTSALLQIASSYQGDNCLKIEGKSFCSAYHVFIKQISYMAANFFVSAMDIDYFCDASVINITLYCFLKLMFTLVYGYHNNRIKLNIFSNESVVDVFC